MADGAWVGIVGTLAGILLTKIFDSLRWKREDRRWAAEPYRQRRCDALLELHAALTNCLPSYLLGDAPRPGTPEDWHKHFMARLVAAHRAAISAKPYLSREQGVRVVEALSVFRTSEAPMVAVVAARDVQPLDIAAQGFAAAGEAYTSAYVLIDRFLSPMLVPDFLKRSPTKTAPDPPV